MADFTGLLLQGFNTGRELKRQEGERGALAKLAVQPGIGDDSEQNRRGAFEELAVYNPQLSMQMQADERKQSEAATTRAAALQKQQREQMGIVAQLTEGVTDEASYQQAIGAARRYGLDVSSAPPSYDPKWVGEMHMIASVVSDDAKLPGIAEELKAAGYTPGTPEFQTALRSVINNKYSSEYVDAQGNLRRRSALDLGSQTPPASTGPSISASEAVSMLKSANPQKFLEWQSRFKHPVLVSSPEEAAALPSGTLMVSPDGRTGTKK